MSLQTLSSYQEVITGSPLGGSDLPIFVVEGCKISTQENPECILYELNSSPCEAMAYTYSLYKVGRHSASTTRQGRVGHQRHQLYDFTKKRSFSLRDLSQRVTIDGRSSREKSYKDVTLTCGFSGWTACAAKGHFAGQIPTRDRLRDFDDIVWKNDDGLIVALETRPAMREDGTLDGKPQLNMHEALPAQDVDLLVACWMARLWMESKTNLDASQPRSSGEPYQF